MFSLTIVVVLIVATAAAIQSTLGFGYALITMPLLVPILGIQGATPLVAVTAQTAALMVVAQDWRHVQLKGSTRLIVGSLAGIPFGLYGLVHADEQLVKLVLAALIAGFSLYNLLTPKLPRLENDRWAFVFGWVAGLFGGAYNVNGPPAVIYGALRRWRPEDFRATLHGFFLVSGLLILAGHAAAGLWTRELWRLYLPCLALLPIAVLVGRYLNKRIQGDRFQKALYVVLLIFAGLLAINSA